MVENSRYDVAVVGGGVVGSAFTLALARAGLTVLLVSGEQVSPPKARDPIDLQVSAMLPASERILSALGVWQAIEAVRSSPFRRMEVWDIAGFGVLTFDSNVLGEPRLGHIVEDRLVQAALRAELSRHSKATVRCPASLQDFGVGEDGVTLELEDGIKVRAALLVGADGADSRVREIAGIPVTTWDYGRHALLCHVRTSEPHNQTCFQRFLPAGPLAFLPVDEGRSSLFWSMSPEEGEELLGMETDDFGRALEEASQKRLGIVREVSERAAVDLNYHHARRYVDERVALIGDAAHVVHPLAGQGVNLGLMDAVALAEVVVKARRDRRDFGLVSELRPYERWRKGDNLIMANTLNALKYMYSTDLKIVGWARNLGLSLVDELKPVKKLLMAHASGVTGDLPRLAMGQPL